MICMISDYSGILDEGMRNTAFYLCRELSKRHRVLHLNIDVGRNLFSKEFWKEIKSFHPQIIHFVPGPTIKSFFIVKALEVYCPEASMVMSATHPALSPFSKRLIPLLKPDLILTQSHESEAVFTHLGCKTRFLPSGVDTEKFISVSNETKQKLRAKYQLDERKMIVLHVGPIKRGRNVLIFNRIQQMDNVQVIIIGSLSVRMEPDVYQSLLKGGCIVLRTYFKNIEEIYALSDCYVFPLEDRLNSIELPLSVMEAMSCNLPVISTRFGGLCEVFSPGDGLHYVNNEEDFVNLLQHIKDRDVSVKTREKVLHHSWRNIALKLEQMYEELLS